MPVVGSKTACGETENAPIRKTRLVSGGSGATGNPCEPMHHRGFVGMQGEAVERIAEWILAPQE